MEQTVVNELILELEEIKKTKCKTLQEVIFFDGVLAIIEAKYISKEKQQIENDFNEGYRRGENDANSTNNAKDISEIEPQKPIETTSSPTCTKPVLPAVFVGQILYREKSYRNEPTKIEEVTVGKIGKKYFYLTGWEERYPIDKETFRYTDKIYSQSGFQLYRNKKEIIDKNETATLYTNIQKVFRDYSNNNRFTLEQLRNISDILEGR